MNNKIQWKLLNEITSRPRQTDNINQMITINSCFYTVMGAMKFDHSKHLITLTVIT